jgi:hypothetical protein
MDERCAFFRRHPDFAKASYLPVAHTILHNMSSSVICANSDCRQYDFDKYFYYLASGCSDLHVKTGTIVVGDNDFDVYMRRLAAGSSKSVGALLERAAAELAGTKVCGELPSPSLLYYRLRMTPCSLPTPIPPLEQCLWQWHPWPFRFAAQMRLESFETTIIKFRGAGRHGWSLRDSKSELIRSVGFMNDTFYDAKLNRCSQMAGWAGMRTKKGACLRCTKVVSGTSVTPLWDSACAHQAHSLPGRIARTVSTLVRGHAGGPDPFAGQPAKGRGERKSEPAPSR